VPRQLQHLITPILILMVPTPTLTLILMAITHIPMVITVIGGGVRGTGVIVDMAITVIGALVTGVMVDAVIMVIGVRLTGVTVDEHIMVPGVRVTGVMGAMGVMGGITGNTLFGQLHCVDDLTVPFFALND